MRAVDSAQRCTQLLAPPSLATVYLDDSWRSLLRAHLHTSYAGPRSCVATSRGFNLTRRFSQRSLQSIPLLAREYEGKAMKYDMGIDSPLRYINRHQSMAAPQCSGSACLDRACAGAPMHNLLRPSFRTFCVDPTQCLQSPGCVPVAPSLRPSHLLVYIFQKKYRFRSSEIALQLSRVIYTLRGADIHAEPKEKKTTYEYKVPCVMARHKVVYVTYTSIHLYIYNS